MVGMIILLLTSCISTGVVKTPLTSQTIIEVPNTSQTDLYVRANSAAVEMFNNASSVIQYSDKDAGMIKGKFIISNVLEGIYYHRINVIISIESKNCFFWLVKIGKSELSILLINYIYKSYLVYRCFIKIK